MPGDAAPGPGTAKPFIRSYRTEWSATAPSNRPGLARISPQTRPPIRDQRGTNIIRVKMKFNDFKSMSADELWSLHERIVSVLSRRISAEKDQLEQRLRQLGQGVLTSDEHASRARRPYPKVVPKYRNPKQPSETWAGRGKQPRWLTTQLSSGKKLDDFRIEPPSKARTTPRKVVANKKTAPKASPGA